ncbi:MAG: PIG-L family deacetylase [Syntrophales bacterium]
MRKKILLRILAITDLREIRPLSPFYFRSWEMYKKNHVFQLTALRRVFVGMFIFFNFFFAQNSFADSSGVLPEFVREDKVLILAPQPDDETIGVGGAIQRAVKAGAKVKVVLLTNGENNIFAFMVYKKSLFLRSKDYLSMGEIRRQESVKAMTMLGLTENDVISLGYPDRGTLEIMTRHWDQTNLYRSALAREEKVPYPGAMSPGAPYSGESVLKDLEKILLDYKPTKIFVSHPADANRDHRGLYLFLRVALWDLDGKIDTPKIYPYLVHVTGWPKPRGYNPTLKLTPPPVFSESEVGWLTLLLAPEEITKKYNAIQEYPSQIKYAPKLLISFARENEFFGDYPVETILPQMSPAGILQNQSKHRPALSYAREGKDLLVRLNLKKWISNKFGVSLTLLPYKRGVLFSTMPKVEVKIGIGGLRAKDYLRNVDLKGVRFTSRGKEIEYRIPLAILGDPDYILSSAKTALKDLNVGEMAWRVLSLEQRPAIEPKEEK